MRHFLQDVLDVLPQKQTYGGVSEQLVVWQQLNRSGTEELKEAIYHHLSPSFSVCDSYLCNIRQNQIQGLGSQAMNTHPHKSNIMSYTELETESTFLPCCLPYTHKSKRKDLQNWLGNQSCLATWAVVSYEQWEKRDVSLEFVDFLEYFLVGPCPR